METYWGLTSKDGKKDPGLKIAPPDPAVDPTAVKIAAITLMNKSAEGPSEL